MFSTLGSIFSWMKRHWLTVAFLAGFVVDLLLLNQVDNVVDNLILVAHTLIATISLLLFYVGVAERGPVFLSRIFRRYAPIVMQYSFGGLFSGMLIFYGRSGDFIASAPFFLLIIAVIFGNEFLSKGSDRLIYHIAVYFVGLFSFVVLEVPVLTGKMGDGIFIISGLIALVIVSGVTQVLFKIVPNFMAVNVGRIIIAIGAVYIGFNVLYFTSLIPPIPLSLTQLEVAQSVEPFSNSVQQKSYRVSYEVQPWYRKVPFTQPVIHPTGETIACFARVYAPTKLSTKIFHHWEYKDINGSWQEYSRIGYEIVGSNKNGYGGYTRISAFFPGVWRCGVETARGQVLGRQIFIIDEINEPKEIKVKIE